MPAGSSRVPARSSRVLARSSRVLAIVFPSVLVKDWCQGDIGACVFGGSCVFDNRLKDRMMPVVQRIAVGF